MRDTPIESEKHRQYMAAIDSVAAGDRRTALRLRADDIDTGKNEAGCPERMRTKVAAYLRRAAKEWP